jgi:long-subunit fatty acid transport protein
MNEKRQFKHIGARLRAERPSPSSGLISAIVARVPERVEHRPSLRLALAAALAVALVSAVAAVGGVGYATKQVSHAASAVKNTVSASPKSAVPSANSAASQYGKPPVIRFVTPGATCVGKQITIHGDFLTGATSVTIGGISADFSVKSRHVIRATVPDGFTFGPVTVTTPAGTATSPNPRKLKVKGCHKHH